MPKSLPCDIVSSMYRGLVVKEAVSINSIRRKALEHGRSRKECAVEIR